MNYCNGNQINAATCECVASSLSLYNENDITICPTSSACVGTEKGFKCLSICNPGDTGPCACRYDPTQSGIAAWYASENLACVQLPNGVYERYFKIAVSEKAITNAACSSPGLPSVLCKQGDTCIKVNNKLECAIQCRNGATTLSECKCYSLDFKTVNSAAPGQFCAIDGTVSTVGEPCSPNSISNGNCSCNDTEPPCPKGSYCVESGGVQKCFAPCDRLFTAAPNVKCACGTAPKPTLLDSIDTCAYVVPGTVDFQLAKPCTAGQIGPCGCQGIGRYESNYTVQFIDANHVCFDEDGFNKVLSLAKLGSLCNANACQTTVNNPQTAIYCENRMWCGATGPDTATIGGDCPYSAVLQNPCMCIPTVGYVNTFAASKQVCRRDGTVSGPVAVTCGADVISDGNCKCNAADKQNCPSTHACAKNAANALECIEKCQPNIPNTLNRCACPTSSGMVILAKDKVCGCLNNKSNLCEVSEICADNKFGPCVCSDTASASYMTARTACIKGRVYSQIYKQCKTGFVAFEACACKKNAAGDAEFTQTSIACVLKSSTENIVLSVCAIGTDKLTSDCACNVADSGAVELCASGSVCKPANEARTLGICVKECTDAADCSDGAQCVDGDAGKHCVAQCDAEDHIVSQSVGCTCGGVICARTSACVAVDGAKQCVAKECDVNTVNTESCFCRLDGAGAIVYAAQYTPTSHVCAEIDQSTRTRRVLPICNASTPDADCMCNTANGIVSCGAKTCILGEENAKDVCAYKCTDGKVSTECLCGESICAVGKTCKSGTCSKDGLSGGAIAGIVVGVLVVAGGAAAGIFFALKAVKAKKTAQNKQNTVEQLEPRTIVPATPPVE